MDSVLSENLEFWMTNLPPKLRSMPLIYLAIPGSHDSMTYGMKQTSKVSPDADKIIKRLKFLGPLLTIIISRWSRTQNLDVTHQLKAGIRYFDLRLATKKNSKDLFFVHNLYCGEVTQVLLDIKNFLDSHRQEVVILDCQHFAAFTQNDHDKMINNLTSIFSHKLVPYSDHMEHLTLDYMTQFRYQVIAVYRSDAARLGQPLLWPSLCCPTPWPDTESIDNLYVFLDNGLQTRPENTAYVSQSVLTPTALYIVSHFYTTLKNKLAVPLFGPQTDWVKKQHPGKRGLNIIISDFINFQDNHFPKTVIGLNESLLDDRIASTNKNSAVTPVTGRAKN